MVYVQASSDVPGSRRPPPRRRVKRPGALREVYDRLLARFGPQRWWPAETRFEVMVGAVLTQATAWGNVEKAIARLKSAGALSPEGIRRLPVDELAHLVYPSGYYNAKARKLKALAAYVGEAYGDDIDVMGRSDTLALREEMLGIHGIGEETADDILLYALGKPVFVIDAYTKRIFHRLGLAPERGPYFEYSALFTDNLPHDAEMFGEYHALIVRLGVEYCKKTPACAGCCLLDICPAGRSQAVD